MLNYNEDIMSVIFRVDNYDENCLYFGECVKNNVKPFSWFSRITYSNSFIALKNIYFSFTLKNVKYKEQYLKTIIYFNEANNFLDELYEIEKTIISRFIKYRQTYTNEVIRPSYCIKTQFKLNYIKVFKNAAMTNINSENTDIFIKISGIWQTDNVVGITFKFI